MAYALPVDLVPALRTALHLATSVVLLVAVDIYYARAGLWPISMRRRPNTPTLKKVGGPSFLPDVKTSVRWAWRTGAKVGPCSPL
jgi:hypothetical protein